MPLTVEVLARLAAIGFASDADLAYWRRLGDDPRVTDAHFLLRLREHEASVSAYYRRLPHLLAFVADRRRADPLPDVLALSAAERAQHDILLGKMQASVHSGQDAAFLSVGRKRPDRAPIVLTSRVGLLAATEVFGGTSAAILAASEWDDWLAGNDQRRDSLAGPWNVQQWWLLGEDIPMRSRADPADLRRTHAIRDDQRLWFLDVGGRSDGSLNETYSLYRWDGQTGTFVDLYGSLDASLS